MYRWFDGRWQHITTSFKSTRFPLVLLVLLPLLLLGLCVCCFAPFSLRSVLPSVNVTEWRLVMSEFPAFSLVYSGLVTSHSQSEERIEEDEAGPKSSSPTHTPPEEESSSPSSSLVDDPLRLEQLERSVASLWQHVEDGGTQAESRHTQILSLYREIQQAGVRDGVDSSINSVLDQQLEELRTRLEEDRQSREQTLLQQQRQTSRLDQLEKQLQTLAAQTEELLLSQEAAAEAQTTTLPAAVSVGVERQSHDALRSEVSRLEADLESVRRDVKSLSVSQDRCERIDTIQQTISSQISSQVREEVRTLIYGSDPNQLAVSGDATSSHTPPQSLLQWLKTQLVSGADLKASMASLELRILRNISRRLEQRQRRHTHRETQPQDTEGTVTQEDVHGIVQNALRLFSQDQTGLADYALESGGGSIMSTRCSQTYETKAALLTLFGFPLWYFSQSPRAVIQPEVHPGNCWAFRGSSGVLVLRLSMSIVPSSFSLEHLPRSLAPSGELLSAPRHFRVYGLDEEFQQDGKLLGTFTYDQDGEALQRYAVNEENERAFQIIEVQVLSNWGHEEFTCIYRFRVHGTPDRR